MNVVSIVDVDVAKSGFIFLVMELVVDGTTLHDVRRRHRDVPWTLGVLAQVAESHPPHHPGLHETREGLGPRVEVIRAGAVSLERVDPVRERIQVDRNKRVGVRAAGIHRPIGERHGTRRGARHDDGRPTLLQVRLQPLGNA